MRNNLRRGGISVLAGLMFLFLLFPAANAQTAVDGAIGGTVHDSNEAVISDASVTVHNNGTNAEQTILTNSTGYFRLIHLQPGEYTVTITATGFQKYKSEGATVSVGSLTTIDSHLKVGGAEETVTVSGAAPLVNTDTPSLSSTISSEQIDNLPINGGRWSSFAILPPEWCRTHRALGCSVSAECPNC